MGTNSKKLSAYSVYLTIALGLIALSGVLVKYGTGELSTRMTRIEEQVSTHNQALSLKADQAVVGQIALRIEEKLEGLKKSHDQLRAEIQGLRAYLKKR